MLKHQPPLSSSIGPERPASSLRFALKGHAQARTTPNNCKAESHVHHPYVSAGLRCLLSLHQSEAGHNRRSLDTSTHWRHRPLQTVSFT